MDQITYTREKHRKVKVSLQILRVPALFILWNEQVLLLRDVAWLDIVYGNYTLKRPYQICGTIGK